MLELTLQQSEVQDQLARVQHAGVVSEAATLGVATRGAGTLMLRLQLDAPVLRSIGDERLELQGQRVRLVGAEEDSEWEGK